MSQSEEGKGEGGKSGSGKPDLKNQPGGDLNVDQIAEKAGSTSGEAADSKNRHRGDPLAAVKDAKETVLQRVKRVEADAANTKEVVAKAKEVVAEAERSNASKLKKG